MKTKTHGLTTHGKSGTGDGNYSHRPPVYRAWLNMRQRCNNPNNPDYSLYGGRGIKVCEAWNVFENFLVDMGEPRKGMTLDRINTNGNYEPNNCRWATRKEQGRNLRKCIKITFKGKTKSLGEWADDFGQSPRNLHKRLFVRKWSIEDAITKPTNA